jgi:hypothetical protein
MSESERPPLLPATWATKEAQPQQVGQELFRQLGAESTVLVYGLAGRNRYYICRFTDNGAGKMIRDPETGEIYENPRPWTRELEILGVADDMSKVLWILQQGKPAVNLAEGNGVRPRLDGSGNWIGFASSGNLQLSAGMLDLIL